MISSSGKNLHDMGGMEGPDEMGDGEGDKDGDDDDEESADEDCLITDK